MSLKKYNKFITSGKWSNKYPKDTQILALVGVAQKIVDNYKKSSDTSNTSNMGLTKEDPAYVKDLPPWITEHPKGGVVNKTKYGKE